MPWFKWVVGRSFFPLSSVIGNLFCSCNRNFQTLSSIIDSSSKPEFSHQLAISFQVLYLLTFFFKLSNFSTTFDYLFKMLFMEERILLFLSPSPSRSSHLISSSIYFRRQIFLISISFYIDPIYSYWQPGSVPRAFPLICFVYFWDFDPIPAMHFGNIPMLF